MPVCYRSNRVALDYNAAFQSAIAALKYLELFPPITTTQSTPSQNTTIAAGYVDETTEALLEEIDFNNEENDFENIDDAVVATSLNAEKTTIALKPVGRLFNKKVKKQLVERRIITEAATSATLTTRPTMTYSSTTTQPNVFTTTTALEDSTTVQFSYLVNNKTSQNQAQNFSTSHIFSTMSIDVTILETSVFYPNSTTQRRPVVIRLTPSKQRLAYLDGVVFGEYFSICFSFTPKRQH